MPSTTLAVVGSVAVAVATVLYGPLSRRAVVLGATRPLAGIQNIHGQELRVIADTVQCEDLHHHRDSGLLFTACQGAEEDPLARLSWFPPLGNFKDPAAAGSGSIYVVDPKTFTSRRLTLENFRGPFVTHGIDVIAGRSASHVYIFAVNHPPDPLHYLAPPAAPDAARPRAGSRVEIFEHRRGSGAATHLRTVRSPLIRTPNDVVATSATSFYVTNDHRHRAGAARWLEDVLTRAAAPWADVVHVSLPADGRVDATVALAGLHTSNGLGRASAARPHDLVVVDATAGLLMRARRSADPAAGPALALLEQIPLPCTLDNPSWYDDPRAAPARNASGYVLAGLARAFDLAGYADPAHPVPAMVWHLRRGGSGAVGDDDDDSHAGWERRLLFQDDGRTLRSASSAVLVPIEPEAADGTGQGRKEGEEKKEAWLFVTGFLSAAMVAARVEL